MATRKTAKIIAKTVDAKRAKISTKTRQAAREAELAATAREEELAKTLVSKSEFRKVATRLQELEAITSQNYDDIIGLDNRLQKIERATMWQSVKKFFGRKVW